MWITGDGGANAVTVTHNGAGQVAAIGDGTTRTAEGIRKIVFDLRGGNDAVTFEGTGPLTRALDLRLNLGAGNDTARLKFDAVANDLSLTADLGAGDDLIDVNLDAEIRSGVAVYLDVAGRAGADTSVLSFNEIRPEAEVYAWFEGGAGDDRLDARLGDPVESKARVQIGGDGGAGNDALALNGFKYGIGAVIAADAVVKVELDGGAGNDTVEVLAAGVSGTWPLRPTWGRGTTGST